MNVIKQVAIYGIASVGMTYVILLGGIDLSIGSIISLVNIIAAYVMVNLGMDPVVAILAALVTSAVIGFINGVIIAELKMPELIVTFESQTIFAGLAGLVMLARANTGQPNAGMGYEFDVITCVVLGGVSTTGGSGKMSNVIAGVMIIGVLQNGMVLLNVSSYMQMVVKGIILLIAVGADCVQRQRLLKAKKATVA